MNGSKFVVVEVTEDVKRRLLAKVRKSASGCWVWTAADSGNGYGVMRVDHRNILAHRLSYMCFVGPIPEGLYLDHLCRNRACVNPAHLEPVTHRENDLRGEGWAGINSRKTECVHGHEYTPENTGMSRGARFCRTCKRNSDRGYYWRAKA